MAGLVLNNNAVYPINTGIIFDLNDYPDISMDEFEDYLLEYFDSDFNDCLNDKYKVFFTFHRDPKENTLAVTAEIVDWSFDKSDPRLEKMLEDIQNKRKKNGLWYSVTRYFRRMIFR